MGFLTDGDGPGAVSAGLPLSFGKVMDKPHSQSVTSTQCDCGYLERSANDAHTLPLDRTGPGLLSLNGPLLGKKKMVPSSK
jgi:hypothetical protein